MSDLLLPMMGMRMNRKKMLGLVTAVLILAPGAALAGHGKAGLWNTVSSTNMAMSMPPEVLAQMKAAGMKIPSVSTVKANKSLGGTLTGCVHSVSGDIVVPWLSLSRFATPFATPFGNLWVPIDLWMPAMLVTGDDRAYFALSLPNDLTFLGSEVHMQAVSVLFSTDLVLTGPASLVLRG